jgi:hypothetical protein
LKGKLLTEVIDEAQKILGTEVHERFGSSFHYFLNI